MGSARAPGPADLVVQYPPSFERAAVGALPFLLSETGAPTFGSCDACPYAGQENIEKIKRDVHCAQIPRSTWSATYQGPDEIGSPEAGQRWGAEIGVCPGVVLVHPFVQEVAEARAAFSKGALETFYSQPTHALLQAVMVLEAAWNSREAQKNRQSQTAARPFPWTKG